VSYIGVREQSISWDIGSVRENTERWCVQDRETQECRDRNEQEVILILIGTGWDLITSEFEHRTGVPGLSEVMWSVSSGCPDLRLARVCQQLSYECYGCDSISPSISRPRSWGTWGANEVPCKFGWVWIKAEWVPWDQRRADVTGRAVNHTIYSYSHPPYGKYMALAIPYVCHIMRLIPLLVWYVLTTAGNGKMGIQNKVA